jgi:phosphate transport system substrate-binding protein
MYKRLLLASAAVLLPIVSSVTHAADVTGAGASFPAPIYAKWADAYAKATNNRINYQSIGSGAGIKQITAKTVDFGASDMPLTPDELTKAGMVQFPTVIGGVVAVVNLAGIKPGELKLTGPVLADIYLGKITKWTDKAIVALNPSAKLPDSDIAVVRRADGSGTSFVFTNYLSKVSADWKSKVGEGTAPQWPVGLGGKGNEGVAAFVQRIPASIGYVEFAYAKQNKLTWTQMQNKDKAFVQPEDDSFAAAAVNADWSHSFYEILTEQPGAKAWPITSATFILMHHTQDQPLQGTEVLKFFDWAYKNGGAMATELDYVPLPDATVKLIKSVAWTQIKDATGKSVFTAK